MTKTKFKVGDRVSALYDDGGEGDFVEPKYIEYDADFKEGTIESFSSGNTAANVKWDHDVLYDTSSRTTVIKVDLLIEPSKVKALESQLEKEFKAAERRVLTKVKEAAKSLKEANKLAGKIGNTLEEMYNAHAPLFDAMDGEHLLLGVKG